MTASLPKLVRDAIPRLIQAEGRRPVTRVLERAALPGALLEKLTEEAGELASAAPDHRLEELADLLEVVRALTYAYGLEWADVVGAADQKSEARGSFRDGVVLVRIDS